MEVNNIILSVLLLWTNVLNTESISVDDYVNTILDFHRKVRDWKLPKNSRYFLKGNEENRDCIKNGSYDFIVIGAGSSGAVIANRLSEVDNWTVLVIEAGGEENLITDIPSEDRNLWLSDYNWGYVSTPQYNVMNGYINNSITIPRGKALGGSSVINSLIYARGNRLDYDKWDMSNPGWSYSKVLPYFKKSENASFRFDQGYHGTTGPWSVEHSRIFDEIGQAYLDANSVILDYNGKNQMGYSVLQVNEIDGRRSSTGKSFLKPVSGRSNIKIEENSLVMKILIDKNIKSVHGVKYIKDGKQYCVGVKKEVILSAGAINSPQLLMLSGVGPKKHLEELGISVVQDLPVGENLWDHLLLSFQYFSTNFSYEELPRNSSEEYEYLRKKVEEFLEGEGSFTSSGSEQAIGYASSYSNNKNIPDIEYVLHTGRDALNPYEYYKNSLYHTKETYESIIKPTADIPTVRVHPILLHPKSRGNIKLKSSSPFDFPLIDPKYFSHPDDSLTFLSAVRQINALPQTRSFQKYNITNIKLVHPLCENLEYDSDDFWLCMIKNLATTTHHFSGTCKMGPRWRDSVVNRVFMVHGISRLRVVDCSVIPVTISGHTNAVGVMLGEVGADVIKRYWDVI